MNTEHEIRNRDEHGRKSEIEMKIDLLVALLCMRSMRTGELRRVVDGRRPSDGRIPSELRRVAEDEARSRSKTEEVKTEEEVA